MIRLRRTRSWAFFGSVPQRRSKSTTRREGRRIAGREGVGRGRFHRILVRIELRQGFRRARERRPVVPLAPAKRPRLIEAPDQPQSTQRKQHRERDAERVLYSPSCFRTLALPSHLTPLPGAGAAPILSARN